MATPAKALQPAILPRLRKLFRESEKLEGISQAIGLLSLGWERPLDKEGNTNLLYSEALEDLTAEQLAQAFSRAETELEFWPSPGKLRQLAGIETPPQFSERRAKEDLSFLVSVLRDHGIQGKPKNGALIQPEHRDEERNFVQARYEKIPPPPLPDTVRNALAELGDGDRMEGAKLVAMHPMLSKDPDEYPTLNFKLSAIEKLEARWLEAWRRANAEISQ